MIWFILMILISQVLSQQSNTYQNDYHNQRHDTKHHNLETVSQSSLRDHLEPESEEELSHHQAITRRGSRTFSYEAIDDGSYDGSLVDTIPGKAGKDYPDYTDVPKTSFSCKGKTPSGYFADVETDCQVFHICLEGGQKISFLCPNGSIFNQKVSVCDWWYDVDCHSSFEEEFSIQKNQIFDDPNFQYQHFIVEDQPYYDLSLASSGGNQNPKYENQKNEANSEKPREDHNFNDSSNGKDKVTKTQQTNNRKVFKNKVIKPLSVSSSTESFQKDPIQ